MINVKPGASILIGAVLAATIAHAGGGAVGGATEFTQLMNNVELMGVAGSSASMVEKAIAQRIEQKEMTLMQQLNLKSLDQIPSNLLDSNFGIGALNNYRNALNQLRGSLAQETQAINQRFVEARLSGKTWEQYSQGVLQDAQNGNQSAIQRINYESGLLQQVNNDYRFAREAEAKIANVEGAQQSLQLLNSQINRIVVQNGKMLEVMANTAVRDGAETQAEKARHKARNQHTADYLTKRDLAIRERQLQFMNGQ